MPSTQRPPRLQNLPPFLLLALALAAALPPVRADETLGRLFFTPERRQAMDRQRQLNQAEKQELQENPTLTINGVVTRSSGKRTVWINGVSQNENDTLDGVSVVPVPRTPGRVVVRPSDAPDSRAAVGDTVNRNTGETSPLLGEGRITIKNAPRTPPATPQ